MDRLYEELYSSIPSELVTPEFLSGEGMSEQPLIPVPVMTGASMALADVGVNAPLMNVAGPSNASSHVSNNSLKLIFNDYFKVCLYTF